MFAEAAHSLAETTNQSFLLVSIKLGRREPTPERPFGFGQERYPWTFMAAVGFGGLELATGGGESQGWPLCFRVKVTLLLFRRSLPNSNRAARVFLTTRSPVNPREEPPAVQS